MFLRITPFLPNWFINIASPLLGVQIWPFFIGTFLGKALKQHFDLTVYPLSLVGVAPPSFLFIRAGTTLYQLTTTSGHISMTSITVLAVFAILSLLPVVLRKWIKRKID